MSSFLCLFLSTSLSLLEELDCSCNELESLPPTIGYLHSLRTFAADENFLSELPREVDQKIYFWFVASRDIKKHNCDLMNDLFQIGNCKNVTVMSLRSNKLEFLPDEIGQMTKLRVLNLSDNRYELAHVIASSMVVALLVALTACSCHGNG